VNLLKNAYPDLLLAGINLPKKYNQEENPLRASLVSKLGQQTELNIY
jgi:hypothetical protein